MRTVLLAWELGAGLGHVMMLRRLADRLAKHEFRLVLVAKTLDAGRVFLSQQRSAEMAKIVQAPAWPSAALSPEHFARTSSASMGDILVTAGVRDMAGLSRLLGEWDDIFVRERPDLVIATYAPAAALAARGRVPLMLVGDGYCLPPDNMRTFPLLHTLTPALDEAVTLSAVNTVLRSRGVAALDHLPQIFSAEARLILTFPLLDPYAAWRREAWLGPLLNEAPLVSNPEARTIFVYLAPGCLPHRQIPAALLERAHRMRIYAPELTAPDMRALVLAGAKVENGLVNATQVLASASHLIHWGGSGLAAQALMAGVPQLILSRHVEQWLTGASLQRLGVGRLVAAYDANTQIAPEVNDFIDDSGLRRQAVIVSRDYRELFRKTDSLGTFEQHCLRLLA